MYGKKIKKRYIRPLLTHRCELIAVAVVASGGEVQGAGTYGLVHRLGNDAVSERLVTEVGDVVDYDVARLATLVLTTAATMISFI